MLVPAGVRLRLMKHHLPVMRSQPGTAWIAPLFESSILMSRPNTHKPEARQVSQTKVELLRRGQRSLGGWSLCQHGSHD